MWSNFLIRAQSYSCNYHRISVANVKIGAKTAVIYYQVEKYVFAKHFQTNKGYLKGQG